MSEIDTQPFKIKYLPDETALSQSEHAEGVDRVTPAVRLPLPSSGVYGGCAQA